MTLLSIITIIKRRFPNADSVEICRLINELEDRIIDEIFSPIGKTCRAPELDVKTDMGTHLLLGTEQLSIYIYYISSVLSLQESDGEAYGVYSVLFNEKFSELAVSYRRQNMPVKCVRLTGGI